MLENQQTINTFMGLLKCVCMALVYRESTTMFNLIENYTRKIKLYQVTPSNRTFSVEASA